MNGKKIFQKERAYLAEAKDILDNGSPIEMRRALSNLIYTCEESIMFAQIQMKINQDIVNNEGSLN